MISHRIAAAVADIDAPISSISITAPSGGDAAILSISVARFDGADGVPAGVDGVSMHSITRAPNYIDLIPMAHDIDGQIIASAWRMGAWDIQRVTYPAGYPGALAPDHADLAPIMRANGWTTWTYRPMMMSPEIRQKAHGARDKTLVPIMLGRDAPVPDITFPDPRPGRLHVLKLGQDPRSKPRQGRPALRATGKQRAYIVALRRGTPEQGSPLPASLTRKEASAIIDRLLAIRDDGND